MNPITPRSRWSATAASTIEPLETRIAPASFVTVVGGDLQIFDAGGFVDNITMALNGASFRFSDPGGLTAGGGATQIDPTTVEVPVASVTGGFSFMGNGGDDTFMITTPLTIAGNVTLDAGNGQDLIVISADLTIGGDASFLSGGGISFDHGVTMAPGKNITANAGGPIALGTPTSILSASGAGAITLTAARDITIGSGASVSTANGDLGIFANQSRLTPGNFIGIVVNAASVTASGTGVLNLSGSGGNGGPNQFGVLLNNGAIVSGGTGSGDHTIVTGFGGNVPGGNANAGIINSGTITSSGGGVAVFGLGGNGGASGDSTGVYLAGASAVITAGGTGSVNVTGIGGDAVTSTNPGVDVRASAQITSGGGNVTVSGDGGPNPGGVNPGVRAILGGLIQATGFGSLTVIGHGGPGASNDFGVVADGGGAFIGTANGPVSITGTSVDGVSVGVFVSNASISAGGNLPLTIVTDSIDIQSGGTLNSGTGPTTISTATAGTLIDFGGSDVLSGSPLTLGLSSSEIASITAGMIAIGDNSAGSVAISTPVTFSGPTNVAVTAGPSAAIFFLGGSFIDAAGGGVTLSSGGPILSGTAANDVICNALTLIAGSDIGTGGDPLAFDAVSLAAFSTGPLVTFNLQEANTVSISNLDAAGGTVALLGGTFQIGSPSAMNPANTLFVGSTLDLNGFDAIISDLNGSGTITNGLSAPTTLTIGSVAGFADFAGVIQDGVGPIAVTKVGAGVAILSGNNTYTGPTTVASGILAVSMFTSSLNNPLILSGGVFSYIYAGSFAMSPIVTLTSSLGGIEVGDGTRVQWNGPVSGTGQTFTKRGAGVLTHAGSPFDVARINVTGGALAAFDDNAFGTAPIDIAKDCAFWVEGGNLTIANNLTLHGGTGASVSTAGPAFPGALVHNAGGGLATFTGVVILAGGTSSIDTGGGDISITGKLTGPGDASKDDAGTLTLANKQNNFAGNGGVTGSGGFTVNGGTLILAGDGSLGASGNTLFINGGTLKTNASFTFTHDIVATGNVFFDVTGTLTLTGTVSSSGLLSEIGPGKLVFPNGVTGNIMVGNGTVEVGDTTFASDGPGSFIIHIMSDGMGGTFIDEIDCSDTDATSDLVFSGPKDGTTTTINRIISNDPNDEIGSIKLGKSVILGSGIDDGFADVDIEGRVGKLVLSDVSAYTVFQLGKGLAYNNPADPNAPSTYTNHPDFKLRNVLGPGVTIDVTGDGTPAGTGGGGLGKVVIGSWSTPGTVKTTQSIGSIKFKKGDCNVVFEVDKLQNGAATTAGVGSLSVPKGAWGSTGSVIEGAITTFTAQQFLAGADLSAGGVGTFKVNGDFLGYVSSTGEMRVVAIKGAFKGSVQASSIGGISAEYFDGSTTGDPYGDPLRHNIVVTDGALGLLKASPHDLDAYGIRNFEIVVATSFAGISVVDPSASGSFVGINNVLVKAGSIGSLGVAVTGSASAKAIQNSIFESNGTLGKITTNRSVLSSVFAAATNLDKVTIGGSLTSSMILAGAYLGADAVLGGGDDAFSRAGTIAAITVTGALTTTSIAAGVDPVDGIFGNGNDIAAAGTAPGGTAKSIGAIILGATSGKATASPTGSHNYAIEAASFKSLKIGKAAVTGFPQFLDLGAVGEDAGDVLVQTI